MIIQRPSRGPQKGLKRDEGCNQKASTYSAVSSAHLAWSSATPSSASARFSRSCFSSFAFAISTPSRSSSSMAAWYRRRVSFTCGEMGRRGERLHARQGRVVPTARLLHLMRVAISMQSGRTSIAIREAIQSNQRGKHKVHSRCEGKV